MALGGPALGIAFGLATNYWYIIHHTAYSIPHTHIHHIHHIHHMLTLYTIHHTPGCGVSPEKRSKQT
jgi:hypothetical protein